LEVDQNRFSVFFLLVWHVLGLDWSFGVTGVMLCNWNQIKPSPSSQALSNYAFSSVAVFQRLGGRFNY
jgi:hypothetical protein